jgi:ABC-type Na+ efflux pump permease subunit
MFRHRGLRFPFTDLLEAVILAIAPIPFPGAAEMVFRAIFDDGLTVFNSSEDRVALAIGGLMLASAILFGIVVGLKRGFRPSTDP